MDARIETLLTRSILGTASPEEEAALQAWVAEDPERNRVVTALRAAAARAPWPARRPAPSGDTAAEEDEAWHRVISRIHAADGPGRSSGRLRRAALRIAAVLVAAVGAGVALEAVPEAPDVETRLLREAGAGRARMRTVVLPDGSRVVLAPQSRLRYPSAFRGGAREVTLLGRAHFDVTSVPEQPFRVRTSGARVTVLGTRFVLRAYPDEGVAQVAVEEGSVSFAPASSPQGAIVLGRGDLGRIAPGASAPRLIPGGASESHFGWLQGRLVFDDTPMATVLRELSRFYDLDLSAPEDVLVRRVSFSIESQSRQDVLDLLSLLLDLDVRREGNEVRLEPKAGTG